MLGNKVDTDPKPPPITWEQEVDGKTMTGLGVNVAGALTYLLGFITGILFLFIERNNPFIRFHALQSIYISVGLIALHMIAVNIPVIGWLLGVTIVPIGIVTWIILMQNAHSGKCPKFGYIGELAERQAR